MTVAARPKGIEREFFYRTKLKGTETGVGNVKETHPDGTVKWKVYILDGGKGSDFIRVPCRDYHSTCNLMHALMWAMDEED